MNYDLLMMTAMKHFYRTNQFSALSILKNLWKYTKFKLSIKDVERLEPSGMEQGIMFVGMNPGEASTLENVWEDPYGRYFKAMLEEAGIDKNQVWMTNLYKKKTPGNRELRLNEMREGWKELELEIRYVDPSCIVALGNQVAQMFPKNEYEGAPVVKLKHPSYINRYASAEERSKYILELKSLKQYE